ncbi:DoxX family protein [Niveibacterium sp. SC-1]|uniref:DoxX family protein n=1 Tax=Niveibacterium sp. SC-1 TaxID=3135646 RepID=UPI00311E4C54
MISQLIRTTEAPIAFVENWLKPLLLLALRLYLAHVFFRSGLTKIDDWDTTLMLFTDEYHVPVLPPAFAAVMGASGELLLPPLLALGIATRFAAAGLFVVNLMAVISYPALFQFECPAGIHQHFFWGTLLLVIVCVGAGRFAFDAWLAGRAKDRP